MGGGDDSTILYAGPDSVRQGRFAALSGGGENAVITSSDSPARTGAPASMLAGVATPAERRS